MNSDKNTKTTQRLRFPEFSGSWEEKPLSSFLFEHKTKSDGKCEVHSVSVSKGVVNQVEYLGRSFAAADTSKYNLAKPNDIIYTKSPTGAFPFGIVKQNKNPYNVIVSPLYAVYTPINKYIGYILDSYFESPAATNNYLSSLIQKGAKNTIQISNDTFVSKNVCLPTDYAEQKKIALFLTEIDALIAAQGQKVEALKERKRGLMQQLFPQPGETTPRLRFPGFAGEWEEKMLGKIGECCAGATPSTKVDEYWNDGSIPWMSSGEVHQGVVTHTAACITQEGYNHSSTRMLPIDTVVIALAGQGKTRGTVAITAIELCTNQSLCGIIIEDKKILNKYVYQFLKTRYNDLRNISAGDGGRGGLNLKIIRAYPIYLPPTYEEQSEISECLSAIDDLIASETAKLKALKTHKRGLMQQMFPNPSK